MSKLEMLALSQVCNFRRLASSISTLQMDDSSLSMEVAEAGLVPIIDSVQRAGVEWEPASSDNMKLYRDAQRELMNETAVEAAARGRAGGLHQPIFKSSPPSEKVPVKTAAPERQPSSDIFLRMSRDNQHKHQPQRHHNKHSSNSNSNSHLPFVVFAASCMMMSARKTRSCAKTAPTASAQPPLADSSSKIPTPRSSSSLLLALISHIVIISLILHQSPVNNQAFAWSASYPHAHQQPGSQKHPQRDTSSRANQLSSEQHYTKGASFDSLMASAGNSGLIEVAPQYRDDQLHGHESILDRISPDSGPDTGRERKRRHLANGISLDGRQAVHKRQQHMNEPDCQRLAVFWAFMQTSYPALSSHLFQWATEMDGKVASDEQFLWSKSYGSARSIGHLLEEAERLVAAQQRPHSASGSGQSAASRWLLRISSNPTYARLIQHMRGSVNKPDKIAPSSTDTSNSMASMSTQSPAPSNELAGSEELRVDSAQISGAPAEHQQYGHYGRVVHYPHEIGNTDNSNGMARTLDKLRVLSQHARQQERQLQQVNEPDLADVESNRIFSPQQDVDLRHQQLGPRPSDSEPMDSARTNFVYGKVLLRPQHANEFSSESRRDPLGTLRELASEQHRQLLATTGARMPDSRHALGGHSPDHYGRVIMSPPSSSSSSSERNERPTARADGDSSNQQHRNDHQPHSEIDGVMDSANTAHLFTADYAQRSLAGLGSDELSNQEKAQRASINGDQNDEDEFDGMFHSGPLKEIEVRQLRSIGERKQQQNEQPDVELVTTTSPGTLITSTGKH